MRFGHNNEFNALYSYNFYECAFFDEGLITAYSGPFLAFYPHLSCFKRPDLCCDPSRFSDEGLRIGAYPACLELFHKDLSGEKEQTERYYQENDELSDNRHMEHIEDQSHKYSCGEPDSGQSYGHGFDYQKDDRNGQPENCQAYISTENYHNPSPFFIFLYCTTFEVRRLL